MPKKVKLKETQLKDTTGKKHPQEIWVTGTSNQLFIRGSPAQTKMSKFTIVTGKTPFLVIGSFWYFLFQLS